MTAKEIKFPENDLLYPEMAEWSRLLVACRSIDFSSSAIVRAIEDVDASVVNLNVVQPEVSDADIMYVDLRITHRNPEAAVRSLMRHGFEVLLSKGSDGIHDNDETFRHRVDELMYVINI